MRGAKVKAQILLFVVLLLHLIPTSQGRIENEGEGEGYDEYKDPNLSESSIQIRTSIICLITLLVILSVLFDLFKEQVEKTTSEQMTPIINQLWQGQ
jgi:hypothetical protein